MGEQFGASRTTVREALRELNSLGLIKTRRGRSGGSFVAEAEPDRFASVLNASMEVLTGSSAVTVEDLEQARALLEIPASRLAAERRTVDQLGRLRSCIPAEGEVWDQDHPGNRLFHRELLEASGNPLIGLMARPVLSVMTGLLAREQVPRDSWVEVAQDHAAIYAAVEAQNGDLAAKLTEAHLQRLNHVYECAERFEVPA